MDIHSSEHLFACISNIILRVNDEKLNYHHSLKVNTWV